jgi:ribose/xylose/arabinose/galactoside ABC-type transport system permease subunit
MKTMNEYSYFGKLIVTLGIFLVVLGGLFLLFGRIPITSKIPGNFTFRKGNTYVFFPLGTGILVSIILTIVLNLIFMLRR